MVLLKPLRCIENDKNPPTLGVAGHRNCCPDLWWPVWERWVAQYSGGEVPSRHPGDGKGSLWAPAGSADEMGAAAAA
jgi:hypothetical protein